MKNFKKEVTSKGLKPIYFFKLSDLLYKKEIVKLIKEKFYKNSEVVYFNLSEEKLDKIINEFLSSGLFIKKKIIVCNEGDALKDKAINELIKLSKKFKVPKSSILIIFFDNLKINSENFYEIKIPSVEELKKFIIIFFKKHGIEVNLDFANFIVENCGYDFNKVSLEIKKILAYADKRKFLTIDEIKDLIKFSGEENIFKLIDFFFEKKQQEAIKTFYNLKKLNVNILQIISIFQKTIINLAKIRSLSVEKKLPEKEIFQRISLPPFVCKKLLRYSKNFKFQLLYKIYSELYNLELLAKTSTINIENLFENFLINYLKWH